jgi:two-component system response regulator YesN
VLDILSQALPAHATVSPIVERTKRIIEERYADRLTLERLAAAAACSKRQLASVFREELRTTVHEYLTRVRLLRALQLIRDGEKIEVVSLMVGYRSKKNFYRHFNTQIGVAPLSYRAAVFEIEAPLATSSAHEPKR